jgi:uncharacterized membrane protein YheB (UPF0754 family)
VILRWASDGGTTCWGVAEISSFFENEWVIFWSIPVFTAIVGYLINWTGLIMLFNPVQLHGIRIRGLAEVARLLPHKLQEIPGLLHGRLGWQGIVPARAAKMGSIAVDKAIAKIGTPAEFYQHLDPPAIAEHIVQIMAPKVPEIVDTAMMRQQPQLWANLPRRLKEAVYSRVQHQLPGIVNDITREIGEHIDQLLDPKIMVIEHFRNNPELVNKIFYDVGRRELKLMVNFGFIFGFLLGIPVAVVDRTFGIWWLLPFLGVIVGWTTNLLGMALIFDPVEEKRILGIKVHGLFLRRQSQVAEVYARIIADEVITLENIGDFLLYGPRGDRTQQMLESAMGPAIDRAAGPARAALRAAVGGREFDAIREQVAHDSAAQTIAPFRDPGFSQRQSEKIRVLFAQRTRELPPRDFVEMLRAAIKEDEWMLYAHGAIMGFAGGVSHLLIFGSGGGH